MRKPTAPRQKSDAEILLEMHLKELGLNPIAEVRFEPNRNWRFDYLVPGVEKYRWSRGFAIEIEGGVWEQGGGGHNRARAFIDDMEKYNHAAARGFKVFRFTPEQILKGVALEFIKKFLNGEFQ